MRTISWSMVRFRLHVRDRKFRERLTFVLCALGAWLVIALVAPEPFDAFDARERTHQDTRMIAPEVLRLSRPTVFRAFPW